MYRPDSRRAHYSLRRSRSHRLLPKNDIYHTSFVDPWSRASSPRGTSSDHPTYYSYRRRSRSYGPHTASKEYFYDTSRSRAASPQSTSDRRARYSYRRRSSSQGHRTSPKVNFTTRVDGWSRSRSDSSIYSDLEPYRAFDDGALSLSDEDWEEISEDDSLSVISVITETDGSRIVPLRRIRRRGSAPELGDSPPRVRGRHRLIEGGRLSVFDIREAEYPRPLLGDSDMTRFEPTGKYAQIFLSPARPTPCVI